MSTLVRVPDTPMARLLTTALRRIVEEMHTQLAAAGHPDLRPAHGYALNAIGPDGTTTVRLADVLGMTKQGAAKLAGTLVERGYLAVAPDPADGRARLLRLTPQGSELLQLAAAIQADLERDLVELAGQSDVAALRRALESMAEPPGPMRPVW